MVLTRVKGGIHRLMLALDSEGVGIFQAIVYIHLALGGAYCWLIAGGVPQAVEDAMGKVANSCWLFLCMGVTICLVGKLLCSKPDKRPYYTYVSGLVLQLAGDIYAVGAFGAFVLATMQTSYWGQVLIGVWVFAGLTWCAFLLVVRDIRRIIQAEHRIRRVTK